MNNNKLYCDNINGNFYPGESENPFFNPKECINQHLLSQNELKYCDYCKRKLCYNCYFDEDLCDSNKQDYCKDCYNEKHEYD